MKQNIKYLTFIFVILQLTIKTFALNKNEEQMLNLSVTENQILAGENIRLKVRLHKNIKKEQLKFNISLDPSHGYIKILFRKEKSSKWQNQFIRTAVKKRTINNNININKLKLIHIIRTDSNFLNIPGIYFLKIRALEIRGEKYLDSNTIKIVVNAPQGEDEKFWAQIKSKNKFSKFLANASPVSKKELKLYKYLMKKYPKSKYKKNLNETFKIMKDRARRNNVLDFKYSPKILLNAEKQSKNLLFAFQDAWNSSQYQKIPILYGKESQFLFRNKKQFIDSYRELKKILGEKILKIKIKNVKTNKKGAIGVLTDFSFSKIKEYHREILFVLQKDNTWKISRIDFVEPAKEKKEKLEEEKSEEVNRLFE